MVKKLKVKPIEELTFTDDFMFGRIMQNPEICKGLLERLLEIKIDKIEYPILQKTIVYQSIKVDKLLSFYSSFLIEVDNLC